MADAKISELERLTLEAFTALSGADYVRQRLINGLSMGTPSLEEYSYVTKSRVKAADSLVTKVLERREKNKKEYSPIDARDIVGLRLLALFRNELPLLVRRFLHFVSWSQNEPFSLFRGVGLETAVEEVIIYATDVVDPYVALCVSELNAFGFYEKDDPRYCNGIPIEIDRKDSRYSSIHIVLWANSFERNERSQIPVEVQLRTSVEDVWGEIDHRLRYKTRQIKKQSADDAYSEKLEKIEHDVSGYLRALKRSLDASSDIADMVESSINSADYEKNPLKTHKNNVSFGISLLDNITIDIDLTKDIHEAAAILKDTYGTIASYNQTPNSSILKPLDRQFDQAILLLKRSYETYVGATQDTGEKRDEACYRLLMEQALCYYWKAAIARSKTTSANEEDVVNFVRQSLALYQLVLTIDNFSEDSVLAFRIATLLQSDNAHTLATPKLEEACNFLRKDNKVPEDHYFRVRIPRQYGIALWYEAEALKHQSKALGSAKFIQSKQLEYYRKALEITLPLIDRKIDDSSLDILETSIERENTSTINNVIEYVLCFLNNGGDPKILLELELSKELFREYVTKLIGTGITSVSRVTRADTIRSAARAIEDRELAVAAAQQVLYLIDKEDFSVLLPDISYQEMREDAEEELAIGTGSTESPLTRW